MNLDLGVGFRSDYGAAEVGLSQIPEPAIPPPEFPQVPWLFAWSAAMMTPVQYRNFCNHDALVGTFFTNRSTQWPGNDDQAGPETAHGCAAQSMR